MKISAGHAALACAALWAAATVSPAHAALITISGTAIVGTTNAPADLAIGDKLSFSVTMDGQVADTGAGFLGYFENALLSASLTADPGNTGTWSPDTAVWDTPQRVRGHVQLSVPLLGSNIPDIGGAPFSDAEVRLLPADVLDPAGTGMLLQDLLVAGPLSTDLNDYIQAKIFLHNELDFVADAEIDSLSISTAPDVPEPASLVLLGSGLLAGLVWKRRRLGPQERSR